MKEKYGAKFVHLEDPEFERHFAVYADDEVEARMVLTPGDDAEADRPAEILQP